MGTPVHQHSWSFSFCREQRVLESSRWNVAYEHLAKCGNHNKNVLSFVSFNLWFGHKNLNSNTITAAFAL